MGRGTYFLKTSLSFQAMTRKTNWYQFATTRDLLQGLTDPATGEGSERNDMAMFVHVRLLRPVLAMNLLFMSLPLVLGGYGRNTFINLGFALGNSALFYGGDHLLPVSGRVQDRVAVPGGLAAAHRRSGRSRRMRWDQIRT